MSRPVLKKMDIFIQISGAPCGDEDFFYPSFQNQETVFCLSTCTKLGFLIVFGFNNMMSFVGHFVSSP